MVYLTDPIAVSRWRLLDPVDRVARRLLRPFIRLLLCTSDSRSKGVGLQELAVANLQMVMVRLFLYVGAQCDLCVRANDGWRSA